MSSSRGKKKSREYLIGRKNIVAAELCDDLQDKIDQVRKVVRNRSKIDIALVLRSCEQAENAVDAAIAKLIGPDGGKECLKEWAVQSKKNRLKNQGDSKCTKATVISSKQKERHNSVSQQDREMEKNERKQTSPSIHQDQDEGKELTAALTTRRETLDDSSTAEKQDDRVKNKGAKERVNGSSEEEVRASRSKERKAHHYKKKKPRPPKKVRDKLKCLVPPEEQSESLFNVQTPEPEGLGNETREKTPHPVVKESFTSVAGESTSTDSTSGVESGSSSNGYTSPSENSPERIQSASSNDVFSPAATTETTCLDQSSSSLATPTLTSTGTNANSEPSLRKLTKDLHRCDVSLSRYQNSLHEQCDIAIKNLRKVFTILRIGLSTREEDIFQEIQSIRQSASLILQRRKSTATSLRKLSEFASHLEDGQVQELKKQLKQFITERRIDEELALVKRFSADPDDLLPSIMNFGKVADVQASYNCWNENPQDAIEKCSIKVQLSPPSARTSPLLKNAPPMFFPYPPPRFQIPFIPGINIPYPIPPHAILKSQSVFNKIPILPTPPQPQQTPPINSMVPLKEPAIEYIDDEFGRRPKYSPEQLAMIQERVRASLQDQGVCLYNPFTGRAMRPEGSPSRTVKKTPTQQRRERKKRQRERERRQKEMEKCELEEKRENGHKPEQDQEEADPHPDQEISTKVDLVNSKVGKPATTHGFRPWRNRRYVQTYQKTLPPPNENGSKVGGSEEEKQKDEKMKKEDEMFLDLNSNVDTVAQSESTPTLHIKSNKEDRVDPTPVNKTVKVFEDKKEQDDGTGAPPINNNQDNHLT